MFHSDGQIYDVYVGSVDHSPLSGFFRLRDFIFGEKTQVVIDPAEEKLRNEFENVNYVDIPFHHILRVSSVAKRGIPKITKSDSGGVTIPFSVPAEH